MSKLKIIIITISVSIVIIVAVSIIELICFRAEIKKQSEIAYLKGQTETLLETNKQNLNEVENALTEFKSKLKEYNDLIKNIKEVGENVKKQLEDFNDRLYSVDTVFRELYDIWSNAE
jgi:predicted translin family RNA/ssDNA-binding protein